MTPIFIRDVSNKKAGDAGASRLSHKERPFAIHKRQHKENG
jgi:hypothetical protein